MFPFCLCVLVCCHYLSDLTRLNDVTTNRMFVLNNFLVVASVNVLVFGYNICFLFCGMFAHVFFFRWIMLFADTDSM